jgi:hypothetical protein
LLLLESELLPANFPISVFLLLLLLLLLF